jgi:hypothetical protein
MNVCSLSGRLTWRPELCYQASGKPELTFRLTVPNGERGRTHWRVDDRPAATERLARAATNARQAAERLADTPDPELRPLVSQLIIESTMAAGTLKNPRILQ